MMAQEIKRETKNAKISRAVKELTKTRKREKGRFIQQPDTQENALKILAEYDSGREVTEIVKDFGITHQAAYKALIKYFPDEWRDSQSAKALHEYQDAKDEFEKIRKLNWQNKEKESQQQYQVAIACARERLKSAQWDLERLLSRLYAQKQEVSVDVTYAISDKLVAARSRIIDHVAPQLTQSSKEIETVEFKEVKKKQ
jgi:hypothetical protein